MDKKIPSDAELFRLAHDHCDETDASGQVERFSSAGTAVAFARDVLRLYGQTAQPAESVEPVGEVFRHGEGRDQNGPRIGLRMLPAGETLPHGTKVFAAPVAAQPSVQDGWPTKEMVTAFAEVFSIRDQRGTFEPAFRAALAAAPPAAEQAQHDSPTPEEEEAWRQLEKKQ